MKILHYAPDALATTFGTPSAVRGWCDALAREGADVTLVVDAGLDARARPARVRVTGVRHHLANVAAGRGKFAAGLRDAFSGGDVVVLHGGWRLWNHVAAAAARASGVPYVVTPHGRYDPHIVARQRIARSVWWSTFERRMLERAAAVHLFFADEPSVVPPDVPVVVAPNGIDAPDLTWRGPSAGAPIVWLGRFDPEHKGLDLLIEAVASIPASERPSVDLYGHDWGDGKARTARLVHRLAVGSSVRIHAPVLGEAKWRVLADATAFVYPSRWEAFGLAPLEAAAVGVPSILSRFPLARELEACGVATITDGSAAGLRAALVDTWRGSSVPPSAGGAALVRDRFSWGTAASRWLAQVEELIRRAGAPSAP